MDERKRICIDCIENNRIWNTILNCALKWNFYVLVTMRRKLVNLYQFMHDNFYAEDFSTLWKRFCGHDRCNINDAASFTLEAQNHSE